MKSSKGKKKFGQQDQKLSFSSAFKQNQKHSVDKPRNTKESGSNRINGQGKGSASKDRSTSKKRERDLTDSGNKNQESDKKNQDYSNKKEDANDMKTDTLNQTDGKSEASSSIYSTNKNADTSSSVPTAHLYQGLETTNGGPTKRPFRATGLLNKSQLKLASYIKQNKDVTLAGTKRFTDKSGEYYLKNIQLQNSKLGQAFTKRLSLNNPQNLENCLNILKGNLGKIKRRASKIVTLLPENSLTPIPMKENKATGTISSGVGKKDLKDAERTAVFIRRMEYATSMKRQMKMDKNLKNNVKKISMIQEWWKTMFKIIKLQKNIRGFLFRKKLMNNLEHQEKLLQFITEFDNIHTYHLYKQFMDNLKKKADYEHSKQMEKCEDFCEKMDNLDKLRDKKNFLHCFQKWKEAAQKRRQDALNNLADKLNNILSNKINQIKKDTLDELRDKVNDRDKALKDKIKKIKDKNGRKKMKDIINAHRLNKKLNDAKNKIDNRLKKEAFDKLKYLNDKQRLKDAFKKWRDTKDDFKKRANLLDQLANNRRDELKKRAEEEEKKRFTICNGVNDFAIIADKPQNYDNYDERRPSQTFIDNPHSMTIPGYPSPDNLFPENAENFCYMAPERKDFDLGDPSPKLRKSDHNTIANQINDVESFLTNKKLREAFDKWKDNVEKTQDKKNVLDNLKDNQRKKNKKKKDNKAIENAVQKVDDFMIERQNKEKKDFLDLLKRNNDIAKAVEKLDDFMLRKKKKKAFDNLRKNAGQSEGFRKLDKLFNDNAKRKFFDELKKRANISKGADKLDKLLNNKLKKDAIDRLKRNADAQKALENLDKLLSDKLKKNFLDNLRKNANRADALNILDKVVNNRKKKQFLDKLKKMADIARAVEKLQKLMDNNDKKYGFDKLKKYNDMKRTFDDLEKLLIDKLKKKFLDRLKKNIYDKEKRNKNIPKAVDKLNKLFQVDPQKREFFDRLKRIANIAKAGDRLNKFMEDKLKGDTFKDLKTMDFVNILDGLMKERDDERKNEAQKKLMDYLKKFLGNDLLREAFNRWKNIQDEIRKKKDILNTALNDNFKKTHRLVKTIKDIDKSKLRKYFNIWRDNALYPDDDERGTKRISNRRRRRARSKSRNKSKLNKIKNLLKKAFNKWKNNASFLPRRNVLEKMKQNKALNDLLNDPHREDLLKKYRKKCLQGLMNIYKKHKNSPLKKYFDRWNRARNPNGRDNFLSNNSYVDGEPFQPKYYNPKHNIHNQSNGGKKKLADDYSDTTSNNASDMDGTSLIETKKETQKPRNYTSQSFFIDKKLGTTKNDLLFNTHTTKQLPMTMKGDFVSLIQENPKILAQKNARIQVTNATCQLDEIMDDENEEELGPEEFDQEISKLKNCDIGNNKILTKVIKNCDYDLYSSRRPFRTKKSKWYSVSIPLNGNEAKWEFLNNIKGEKAKNNINKFELIQNETLAEKIVEEEEELPTESRQPIRSDGNKPPNTEYKLREINYAQFYRSPIRSPKLNEEDEEEKLRSGRVIRRPEQRRGQRPYLEYNYRSGRQDRSRDRNLNNRPTNNIIRSKGIIQLDPKYRSIDYDNGYADVDDSEEDYRNNYDYNKKKLFP